MRKFMMEIRTTPAFKVRRLARMTKEVLPEVSEKSRRKILARIRLLNGDKMEREIYSSCIVLKNLAIVHKDLPMSADYILEQLMESSRALRNIYADILSAYRNGKGEAAFDVFYEQIPIKPAKNFAYVLSKIDKINPAELITHMTAFEETLSSQRMTRGMGRAERKSIVTTLAATAAIFAILLNFVLVVVFMDALRMLGQVF